jgi:hypothetical protein
MQETEYFQISSGVEICMKLYFSLTKTFQEEKNPFSSLRMQERHLRFLGGCGGDGAFQYKLAS